MEQENKPRRINQHRFGIDNLRNQAKEIPGWGCLVIVLCFIPYWGFPFAIISIVWGSLRWSRYGRKLVVTGILGIIITGIPHTLNNLRCGSLCENYRTKLVQEDLYTLFSRIEFSKLSNDRYPETIDFLPEDFLLDHTILEHNNDQAPLMYYYETDPAGEYYYLFSVGVDGIPFTEDDIYPILSSEMITKEHEERIGCRSCIIE